jgi:hypothetical protein
MHLDFLDQTLRRLAAEEDFFPAGWDGAEIRHFRLVAQCVRAAKVEGDLHATRILRLRAHHDGEPGTSLVQLSASRWLVIAFKNDSTSATAVFSVSPPEVVSKKRKNPNE